MRIRSGWVKAMALIGLLLAVAACTAAKLQPTVILISLGGFRWDYQQMTDTPNLKQMGSGLEFLILANNSQDSKRYNKIKNSRPDPLPPTTASTSIW